jgi:hypothetical protein
MYKVKESEKIIILKKNIKELKIVKRGIEDLASKKKYLCRLQNFIK